MQIPPAMHVMSFPGRKPAGRLPSCCQLWPKSGLCADHVDVPSLTTAVQSVGLAQVTLETTRAFCGDAAADQVAPASLVEMTTPLPGSEAPLEPTAMHSVAVGQETPLSWGVLPSATRCAFHVRPPLVVASITVATLEVSALGPAMPTAQQRRSVAHDSAPSSPVPLGAG